MKSFDKDIKLISQFKQILSNLKIDFENATHLNDALNTLKYLANYSPKKYTKYIKGTECYYSVRIERNIEQLKTALFLSHLMEKLSYLKNNPELYKLSNHLRLITETNFAQNIDTIHMSDIERDKNNKIWEFFLAIGLLHIGHDLEIESPNMASKSNNPDILITIDHLKWGIACKAINSANNIFNVKTYFERLQEGLQQIENSKAEKGVVVFNLKNVLPHRELLFNFGNEDKYLYNMYENVSMPEKIFKDYIENSQDSIKKHMLEIVDNNRKDNPDYDLSDLYNEVFQGKAKCLPQWVNYYYSNTLCLTNGKIVFESFPRFGIMGSEVPYSIIIDLVNKLNPALN